MPFECARLMLGAFDQSGPARREDPRGIARPAATPPATGVADALPAATTPPDLLLCTTQSFSYTIRCVLQVATLLFAAATMAPPPRRFGESPDIVGIWRAEGADVPALRGQMVVERGTRGWIASVGNVRATAPANASSITF